MGRSWWSTANSAFRVRPGGRWSPRPPIAAPCSHGTIPTKGEVDGPLQGLGLHGPADDVSTVEGSEDPCGVGLPLSLHPYLQTAGGHGAPSPSGPMRPSPAPPPEAPAATLRPPSTSSRGVAGGPYSPAAPPFSPGVRCGPRSSSSSESGSKRAPSTCRPSPPTPGRRWTTSPWSRGTASPPTPPTPPKLPSPTSRRPPTRHDCHPACSSRHIAHARPDTSVDTPPASGARC